MPGKRPKTKKQSPSKVVIERDELAQLAYELYQRRGGEPGHDVEDWLEAERILMKKISQSDRRRSQSHALRRLKD